jgi:hypothetical protein
VYWLRHPPWLRWAAVGLLLATAAFLDLRSQPTVRHPFAAAPIAAGDPVPGRDVTWRQVPRGLLPAAPLDGAVAAHDIEPGDPILPSSLTATAPFPEGWWAVPLTLPDRAVPGSPLRAVIHAGAEVVDGVVVAAPSPDDYEAVGLAAFPGETAVRVAAAAMTSDVVVLLTP